MAIIPSFIPGAENINNAITNFLEGGVVGIESIRSINYGTNYLWTMDFIDTNGLKPPQPFERFFPASDVTLNLGKIEDHTFEAGHTSLSFPRKTGFKSIDITFYDDEKRGLQRWMSDWINIDILNNGEFMSGLNDSHTIVIPDSFGSSSRGVQPIRQVKLALLDRSREEALVYNYLIVPTGDLDFQGTQASEATQFQMRFNIVQQLGNPKAEDPGVFQQVKKVIGQLIGRFF